MRTKQAKPHTIVMPPIPEGNAVYEFPAKLLEAHSAYQEQLLDCSKRERDQFICVDLPILKHIKLPPSLRRGLRSHILLSRRNVNGRPIVALEPHADDVALSIGGLLFASNRPLTIITIFSGSTNLHPELWPFSDRSEGNVTKLRIAESQAVLGLLQGKHIALKLREAPWPHMPPKMNRIDELCLRINKLLAAHGDAELIAPACVSRHPDHILVRMVAERLGCRWFWDDVDFYVNYARSVEDREYFYSRWGDNLRIKYHTIDRCVLQKFALLTIYQSQYFPLCEMTGPIRYNWAVAAEARRTGELERDCSFAERTFHTESR